MINTTTEQQRFFIRTRLAQLMGYKVIKSPYKDYELYRLISPSGDRSGLCDSESEAWSLSPDPFTISEDTRELVKWLSEQDTLSQARFEGLLRVALIEGFEHSKLRQPSVIDYLSTPPDVITFFIAKALGIDVGDNTAPLCPNCGNNRQVWINQMTGVMTCHHVGCHTEISQV